MERFKFLAVWLCALCVLTFIAQLAFSSFTDAFLLDENAWQQPWRFVTAIFLHGDIGHLLYNMFALGLFGSVLERLIGEKRFLLVFFVTGIIANVISVNFYPASLGASGAIFGVIGALIIIRPLLMVWAVGVPMPIFIAGILWAFGDIAGIFAPSNVGNIAHLSGLGFGLILGLLFRDWSRTKKDNRLQFNEEHMRRWEDTYLG